MELKHLRSCETRHWGEHLVMLITYLIVLRYPCYSEVYTVSGHVQYETLGHPSGFWQYDFDVAVSNETWAIVLFATNSLPHPTREGRTLMAGDFRTFDSANPTASQPHRWKQVYDGTNLCATTYLAEPVFITNGPALQEYSGLLHLETNDIPTPDHDGGVTGALWLAYASSHHLDSIDIGTMEPIWFLPIAEIGP